MLENETQREPAETLQTWLGAYGFRDNPFATQEATREKETLGQYFVSPTYFDEIQGDARAPRTSFVFAPRGGGKSAMCMMIEKFCRFSLEGEGKILAVPYNDFTPVAEAVRGDFDSVTPRLHVNEILKHAVAALASWLNRKFVQQAYRGLSEDKKTLLQWYLITFAHCLSPDQIFSLQDSLALALFSGTESLLDEVEPKAITKDLAILLTQRRNLSPVQLLRDFVHLVRYLGIDALYILVDGVDELLETATDTQAATQLLAPLTANLRLLDMPHLAFKFFLPTEIMDCLLEQGKVRQDRVLIRQVRWSEADLAEILRRRLRTFNQWGHDSLAAICVPELRDNIDQDLIQLAERSPRNLLRLGELLLSEHCRIPTKVDQEINPEDWRRARERWAHEKAPSSDLVWHDWEWEKDLPAPIVVRSSRS